MIQFNFNLIRRKNVHAKKGEEYALYWNVEKYKSNKWCMHTWEINKKPTKQEIQDIVDLITRTSEICFKCIVISEPDFNTVHIDEEEKDKV